MPVSPASIRSSVVLPAPLRPASVMRSRRSSLNETSRNSGVPAMSLSSADAITTAMSAFEASPSRARHTGALSRHADVGGSAGSVGRVDRAYRPKSRPTLAVACGVAGPGRVASTGSCRCASCVALGLTRRRGRGAGWPAGRLHRLHRGVYAVGHAALYASRRGELAAVLACGPGALLSHRVGRACAGRCVRASSRIEVTVPRSRRPRPGHPCSPHARLSRPRTAAVVDGIPVTSPARTLVDLADVLSERGWPTRSTRPRCSASST